MNGVSETAFFVKDMIGPKGCVSIVAKDGAGTAAGTEKTASASHDSRSRTDALRLHHAALTPEGTFAAPDEIIATSEEPDHPALCELEQRAFLDAIVDDRDLSEHLAMR